MVVSFRNTKMERTLLLPPKDFHFPSVDRPRDTPWNPKTKVNGRELLEDFSEGF